MRKSYCDLRGKNVHPAKNNLYIIHNIVPIRFESSIEGPKISSLHTFSSPKLRLNILKSKKPLEAVFRAKEIPAHHNT